MYMEKPSFDPGLTEKYTGAAWRAINRDGTFNVRRSGTTWRDFHPYLALISISWPRFFLVLFVGYVLANTAFAVGYFLMGPRALNGVDTGLGWNRFLEGFFFSAHTLTTVGYGNIYPATIAATALSAFEAWVGVLFFAVAAGLLFGRVAHPTVRFGFSRQAVIAPYQDGQSLQFRLVNRRASPVMDIEARVMLMTVEPRGGQMVRRYQLLNLERQNVMFLALTWTIVHPIDERSPFWGKTAEDLARLQAEVMILMKAYDDTFSQTVMGRYSYRHDEIEWGVRYAPAFSVGNRGEMILELQKLDDVVR